MPKYRGAHRITVTGVQADRPQRAVATVRGGGTVVVPGVVGASELIDAADWELSVEHEHDGAWGPSIRAVVGRWEERGGTHSQVVRCTDRDRSGYPGGRSLVLRIDREDPRPPAAPASAPAPRRAGTESAGRQEAPGRGGARISTSGSDLPSTRPADTAATSRGFHTTSGGW
ncbi:hypothetical protein ABT263_35040 [Kitasatospora sp. NPDC001603]|uniref:hypothetical protein n=1 Tax=Kitasatospora sp. NPDC001603 TaxID=3154388 RepID=UPI00332A88CD